MSTAIEVWLTQRNISVRCMIVEENEHTMDLAIRSLDMRGAQREVTSSLKLAGYTPVGRWSIEAEGETMRRFRTDVELPPITANDWLICNRAVTA